VSTGAGDGRHRRRADAGHRPRGDVVRVAVERLVAGGDGLARREGKALFVPGVLPGERVAVRLVESRRDFDRAVLVEVLEPSPDRVPPACALAGRCGGCDWLHVAHHAQLASKRTVVRETLRRTGRIERDEPLLEPGPPFAYRNRVQLHRDPSGALGYREAGGTRVVTAASCPVAVPAVEAFLADPPPTHAIPLDRFTVFGDDGWAACEGRDDDRELAVVVAGRAIRFSVGCFFQSNLAELQRLARHVTEAIGSGGAAADLYAGVGLFSAFLADRFARVIAVESSSRSLAFASRNAASPGVEGFPLTVEHWIAAGAPGGPFDAVIADPPRAGLGREVRAWLAAATPRTLVYVSCNPVTLARDLGELVGAGYGIDDLRLFDFSPQTSHVESVAVLRA
jgi:23S rRNA (uracil1939-C5)-methyltransferase